MKQVVAGIFLLVWLGIPLRVYAQSTPAGDANGDLAVDGSDYLIWLSNFGLIRASPHPTILQGNFNDDEKVDGSDYLIWLSNFGKAAPTPTPVRTTPGPTIPPGQATEWTQHAHDAQHTSYTDQLVTTPWKWAWSWNGSNASGGVAKVTTNGKLPRNVQPVTGGGRVYIAAGSDGIYALNESSGSQVWKINPGGSINSTVAYDGGFVFAVSSNGILYKLDAATGTTAGQFSGTGTSDLPLPPAVISDRVFFSMGSSVYAVNKSDMKQIWVYNAGSTVATPPAYSAVKNRVVVGSSDLYVHIINNLNGQIACANCRVKKTPLYPGDPGTSPKNDLAEMAYGWPVIAEKYGYVLIKMRLDWQTMWTWSPWPSDNATMRSNLTSMPDEQALLVIDLDDGSVPYIANIGNGGWGDGDYMPMGPQPVVKTFSDGSQRVFTVIRGHCLNSQCDGRMDSSFGEMSLDTGFVRPMDNMYFPTDEQANVSMAGNQMFGAVWMFGLGREITNFSTLVSSDLPHIINSSTTCNFSSGHSCGTPMTQDGDARVIPPGFYIYYNQPKVYDHYWSGYATWVVSNNNVYFRSCDGAIVALTKDTKVAGAQTTNEDIAYTSAREYVGKTVTVTGKLNEVFSNGKAVYLTFTKPHAGNFIAKILKENWSAFPTTPEKIYNSGDTVKITGKIEWYQGDPIIYITSPDQIRLLDK